MTPRMNPYAVAPKATGLLIEFGQKVEALGLEKSLIELVKVRASQINGCGICLHMHSVDARKHGESEIRIVMLDAWHESPLYTDRERAALGWVDALTRLDQGHASDAAYEALCEEFSEAEQVQLTMMIIAINGFNRIGVGFRLGHPDVVLRKAA